MLDINVIDELNELMIDIRERFYDINCGGCGVMAAIVGEVLEQRYEIRVAVMPSMFSSKTNNNSFDYVRHMIRTNISNENIKDWNDYDVSFGHVWIEFKYHNKWYAIDAGECVPEKKFKDYEDKYHEYMTLEGMEILGNNPIGWNMHFDRSQIPEIKKVFIKETNIIFN